jgi:chromosome partitioning protein
VARVICVPGQANAIGKTTTAVNLGVLTAMAGHPTLLVDWDPNATASRMLGLTTLSIHPWAAKDFSASTSQSSGTENLWFLGGAIHAQHSQAIEAWEPSYCAASARQIRDALTAFEFVFLDCPPTLNRFTETALCVASEVLLPVRCDYWGLSHIPDLVRLIRGVRRQAGQELGFAGVLLTQHDALHPETSRIEDGVREFFGDILFETVIPKDSSVTEASYAGAPVVTYEPRSRSAYAYLELCMEVMER